VSGLPRRPLEPTGLKVPALGLGIIALGDPALGERDTERRLGC
jgi:aryl-alcohol dehydrogenase-like predicted oxidoreductase